jgi:hypothetical protein
MNAPNYLHLKPGTVLPELDGVRPFKAVVIIEAEVTPDWQTLVSDWLVRSGCRYMMAWGLNCSDWDDSVDYANLDAFDYGDIPDDASVMTTWHEQWSLQEVFEFSELWARHRSLELERTYLIHISQDESSAQLLKTFRDTQEAILGTERP